MIDAYKQCRGQKILKEGQCNSKGLQVGQEESQLQRTAYNVSVFCDNATT